MMRVGTGTVSRWASEAERDLSDRQIVRTWRSMWAGYPSPLPAYDRVYEKLRGRSFLETCFSRRDSSEVLAELREEGLSLLGAGSEEEICAACKHLQIPSSSRRRWMKTSWPSQWGALDLLSLETCGVGWPELVLVYEPTRAPLQLPGPGLSALLRPIILKISQRSGTPG